jgi:hypothetical protein
VPEFTAQCHIGAISGGNPGGQSGGSAHGLDPRMGVLGRGNTPCPEGKFGGSNRAEQDRQLAKNLPPTFASNRHPNRARFGGQTGHFPSTVSRPGKCFRTSISWVPKVLVRTPSLRGSGSRFGGWFGDLPNLLGTGNSWDPGMGGIRATQRFGWVGWVARNSGLARPGRSGWGPAKPLFLGPGKAARTPNSFIDGLGPNRG